MDRERKENRKARQNWKTDQQRQRRLPSACRLKKVLLFQPAFKNPHLITKYLSIFCTSRQGDRGLDHSITPYNNTRIIIMMSSSLRKLGPKFRNFEVFIINLTEKMKFSFAFYLNQLFKCVQILCANSQIIIYHTSSSTAIM